MEDKSKILKGHHVSKQEFKNTTYLKYWEVKKF